MTIPAGKRLDETAFLAHARELLDKFAAGVKPGEHDPSPTQRHAVHALERACEAVTQPLHRIEHALHPWVAFAIMPVFALANAGVSLTGAGGTGGGLRDPVGVGVFVGLLVGKQLGVFAFAWLAVRAGLARLPVGATWTQLYGVAVLCGIGFTMSLFIASLAFPRSPDVLDSAKLGILAASAASALVGTAVLLGAGRSKAEPRMVA
jgi:NhaA family Na+:H+ antiporter